jgi:hypothetical protein
MMRKFYLRTSTSLPINFESSLFQEFIFGE